MNGWTGEKVPQREGLDLLGLATETETPEMYGNDYARAAGEALKYAGQIAFAGPEIVAMELIYQLSGLGDEKMPAIPFTRTEAPKEAKSPPPKQPEQPVQAMSVQASLAAPAGPQPVEYIIEEELLASEALIC